MPSWGLRPSAPKSARWPWIGRLDAPAQELERPEAHDRHGDHHARAARLGHEVVVAQHVVEVAR